MLANTKVQVRNRIIILCLGLFSAWLFHVFFPGIGYRFLFEQDVSLAHELSNEIHKQEILLKEFDNTDQATLDELRYAYQRHLEGESLALPLRLVQGLVLLLPLLWIFLRSLHFGQAFRASMKRDLLKRLNTRIFPMRLAFAFLGSLVGTVLGLCCYGLFVGSQETFFLSEKTLVFIPVRSMHGNTLFHDFLTLSGVMLCVGFGAGLISSFRSFEIFQRKKWEKLLERPALLASTFILAVSWLFYLPAAFPIVVMGTALYLSLLLVSMFFVFLFMLLTLKKHYHLKRPDSKAKRSSLLGYIFKNFQKSRSSGSINTKDLSSSGILLEDIPEAEWQGNPFFLQPAASACGSAFLLVFGILLVGAKPEVELVLSVVFLGFFSGLSVGRFGFGVSILFVWFAHRNNWDFQASLNFISAAIPFVVSLGVFTDIVLECSLKRLGKVSSELVLKSTSPLNQK